MSPTPRVSHVLYIGIVLTKMVCTISDTLESHGSVERQSGADIHQSQTMTQSDLMFWLASSWQLQVGASDP